MSVEEMLKSVMSYRKGKLISRETDYCLSNVLCDNYGRYQIFNDGKKYCANTKDFCPLQKMSERHFLECNTDYKNK
jgi:hypothetical protein